MMDIQTEASTNFEMLKNNTYPGRGIVIGESHSGDKIFQIYWIMGRSANSRNRIFVKENNGFVRTQAFDESKVEDPSLIIYYPVKHIGDCHIVTNGDQTDTIFDYIADAKSFEDAIATRNYEPDAPNFTPRISGLTNLKKTKYKYSLSSVNKIPFGEPRTLRSFYNYESGIPGYGHFIRTYEKDGNPLPSFTGTPIVMPIFSSPEEILEKYWDALNNENRISLLVKIIDITSGNFEILIKNRFI